MSKTRKTEWSSDLTLSREDEFAFKPMGKWHCGILPDSGIVRVRYQVEVTCAPRLDEHGFLVDNMVLRDFFRQLTSSADSCELLAMHAARDLVAYIAKHAPTCVVMRVGLRLSPEPFQASSSTEYYPDMDKATMARAHAIHKAVRS